MSQMLTVGVDAFFNRTHREYVCLFADVVPSVRPAQDGEW